MIPVISVVALALRTPRQLGRAIHHQPQLRRQRLSNGDEMSTNVYYYYYNSHCRNNYHCQYLLRGNGTVNYISREELPYLKHAARMFLDACLTRGGGGKLCCVSVDYLSELRSKEKIRSIQIPNRDQPETQRIGVQSKP